MRVNIRVRNTLKTILLITVVVLFVLSLSSCGHSKIEGVIIEKYYEPPSTYITAMPIIANGKTVIIPLPQYRGAQYKIKARCVHGDGTVCITKQHITATKTKCIWMLTRSGITSVLR